jgi:SprT protein
MQTQPGIAAVINPIDDRQKQQVIQCTEEYIQRARELFDYPFDSIPVRFDLKGRAAGMYVVRPQSRYIRYNPYIFAKYFQPGLTVTIPHEVAHYIVDILFGLRHVQPHGREWRRVMQGLGIEHPRATGVYDLQGIPVRRQKRFRYFCGCREHQLSSVRHHRVLRRRATYHCRQCAGELRYVGEEKDVQSS